MLALCLRFTTLFFFSGLVRSYLITSETREDEFPIQVPNLDNPKTFFRINGTEIEELECPGGYEFDKNKNHCVKVSDEPENVFGVCLPLKLSEGDHANPDSCQTFYSCNSECCYLNLCPSHLLFSPTLDQCLYPADAQCCEYVEKNSNRLVQ